MMTDAPAAECPICRMQGSSIGAHWAWHNVCRGEINPVALVLWLMNMPQTDEIKRTIVFVVAVTGMDLDSALSSQPTKM